MTPKQLFFPLSVASALALALTVPASTARGQLRPELVSPGETGRVTHVDRSCPTFSWGAHEAPARYQLLVYEIGEQAVLDESAELVLEQRLPGTATSWTPPADRCLRDSTEYAWAVGAFDSSGRATWSSARLFSVRPTEKSAEVLRALELLREVEREMELGEGEAGDDRLSVPEKGGAAARLDGLQRANSALTTPAETALRANANAATGVTAGVHGTSISTTDGSAGVLGQSTAATGATAGVLGEVSSSGGVAGLFDNLAGGKIISGLNNGVEVLSIDGAGNLVATGSVSANALTGNAAAAFAASDQACSAGQVATGIDSNGDLVCATATASVTVSSMTAEGTVDACHDSTVTMGGYETIGASASPTAEELKLDVTVTETATVLIQFDITVRPNSGGGWAAFRLNVGGVPDTRSTQSQDSIGDESHVHLHRIATLSPGTTTITAEWGKGNGQVCNNAGDTANVYMRRLSALILEHG